MALSFLKKKMNLTKSLVVVFLVGLFSLTFFVFNAKAAVGTLSSPAITAVTSTHQIQFSFATSSNDTSITFGFSSSTDNVTWTVTTTVATSTGRFFDFLNLATNTLYYLRVAEGDVNASSSYVTSSAYTLATTPGTPTVTSTNSQTMKVIVNSSTNPASTTYIVRDTASSTQTLYLQGDQTWGVATATFTMAQLGGNVNGTTTIGLATNTLHQISVAAVNGAGATTTYGAVATVYTLAQTPAAPTVTSANPQRLTVVINPAGNPTTVSTTFIVRDTASSTLTKYLQSDQTWGNATATFNYSQLGGASGTTTIGLATSTPHIISVAAINGDSTQTTTYSTTVVISTIPNTPTSSVSAATLTTITVTINSSTNPTSTLYIVRDTGGSTVKYLQSDFTWGTTTATINFINFVAGVTSTITTGLSGSSAHIISVAAVSGDNTETTTYSSTATIYNLSNAPSSVSLSAASNGFNLSWNGDSGEQFWAEDANGLNSAWSTDTSFSIGGINCGVTDSFTVAGRNGDGVVTASSSVLTGTTNACGGSGSGGGGGGGAPSNPFNQPKTNPNTNQTTPPSYAAAWSAPASSNASPMAVFVHTLTPGTRGGEVKALQQKLRELGFFKYKTNTGTFGPSTRAAVMAFQKAHKLKPVGFVGPGTRAALNNL